MPSPSRSTFDCRFFDLFDVFTVKNTVITGENVKTKNVRLRECLEAWATSTIHCIKRANHFIGFCCIQ